jgi:hypothetical protein
VPAAVLNDGIASNLLAPDGVFPADETTDERDDRADFE